MLNEGKATGSLKYLFCATVSIFSMAVLRSSFRHPMLGMNMFSSKSTSILSNVNGEFKEYKIEIQRTYLNNNYDNKNMVIKVTDKELLNKTGGIIQGMSGSPVIQNGTI